MSKVIIAAFSAVVWMAALDAAAPGGQQRPLKVDAQGEPDPATATSFDCGKAVARVERMICSDRILALLDGSMGEQFQVLRRNLSGAKLTGVIQSQRTWRVRRDQCADRQCVEQVYDQRSKELRRISEARIEYLRRNVARVGQCEATRIQSIGPRLHGTEGEAPQGTSVALADGVSVVSYERVAAVLSSHVGDPARVCLISVPQGCPRGDKRAGCIV